MINKIQKILGGLTTIITVFVQLILQIPMCITVAVWCGIAGAWNNGFKYAQKFLDIDK